MPKKHRPRFGSLAFWPRKRAERILSSANWPYIENKTQKEGLLGFICYKTGMLSILAQDLTPTSMTLNEQIVLPVTVVECPPMKVFAIQFHRKGRVITEVLADNLDKELRKRIKLPKEKKALEDINLSEIDDVRVICYSKAPYKKTPEICEIGIKAESAEKKLEIAKSLLGKEINVADVFKELEVVDIKAVTKGKGFQGPVKRFGIGLKSHKSEKGRRRPGSLGPWTPKRVSFKAPMAGQVGFFTRTQYNNQILIAGKKEDAEKFNNQIKHFDGYGILRNAFLVIKGSLQGAKKRPLLLTAAQRAPRKADNYKFLRAIK